MKKLPFLLIIAVLFSCKGSNDYTMETTYKETKSNGDSAVVTKKEKISAESDSVAYVKADAEFKKLVGKVNTDGLPVDFIVRDNKGVVITAPGLDSTLVKEKIMYPNQKSD